MFKNPYKKPYKKMFLLHSFVAVQTCTLQGPFPNSIFLVAVQAKIYAETYVFVWEGSERDVHVVSDVVAGERHLA